MMPSLMEAFPDTGEQRHCSARMGPVLSTFPRGLTNPYMT